MQELKLPEFARTVSSMFEAIPIFERRIAAPQRWLARAEQARRIGVLLSPADASTLEAYARECEAEAAALLAARLAA